MSTFNILYEAMQRGNTIGEICQYHARRDGQITLHVLLIPPEKQRQGIGRRWIQTIECRHPEATCIVAKCPDDLPGHHFYPAVGFVEIGRETLRSGRVVVTWRKEIGVGLGTPGGDERYSLSDMDNHWSHER